MLCKGLTIKNVMACLLLVVVVVSLAFSGCAPAAAPTPTPKPAAPKTEPAAPKTEPAAPKAEPAAPKAEPAAPKAQPPAATPAAPKPAAAVDPKSLVTVRIGHGFASEEQLWLMKARPDLTPNQGKVYNAEFTAFRGHADRVNAFIGGHIDGGTTTGFSGMFARGQDIKMKLVATISQESTKGFATTYLVNADSGITDVKGLKGKNVGIVDYKSSTDLWAREALRKAGIDPERDAKLVVIPFPNQGDALRSKKIDVGVFPQPFYANEMKKGGVKELFNSKYAIPFDEDLMVIWFGEDFLKKQPQVVKAFLSDLAAVSKYYNDKPEEARKALIDAKMVQVDADIYVKMQDNYRPANIRPDVEGMKKLHDLVRAAGWLEKDVDLKEFIDLSYLP